MTNALGRIQELVKRINVSEYFKENQCQILNTYGSLLLEPFFYGVYGWNGIRNFFKKGYCWDTLHGFL